MATAAVVALAHAHQVVLMVEATAVGIPVQGVAPDVDLDAPAPVQGHAQEPARVAGQVVLLLAQELVQEVALVAGQVVPAPAQEHARVAVVVVDLVVPVVAQEPVQAAVQGVDLGVLVVAQVIAMGPAVEVVIQAVPDAVLPVQLTAREHARMTATMPALARTVWSQVHPWLVA